MKSALFLILALFSTHSFAQHCTDYSGFWKGTCVTGSSTDEVVLSIQQFGCSSIREGWTPTVIGESTTSTWTNGTATSTRTTTANWSSLREHLDITVDLLRQAPAGTLVIDSEGTMKIINGQLVVDVAGTATQTTAQGSSTSPYSMSCTYNKVDDVY
jgi:hypothetical protein